MIWPYDAAEVLEIVGRIATENFAAPSEPTFLARGSNNAAFAVETELGMAVIRVTGEWRRLRTLQERWCYEQAATLGIPGPEVLAVGQVEKLPYIILSFVEGISGTETGIDPDHLWRTLGQYARAINGVDIGQGSVIDRGQLLYEDPLIAWHNQVNRALEGVDRGVFSYLGIYPEESAPRIRQALLELRDSQQRFGLSHGDLDPRNVIDTPDGRIHLIDWCCSRVSLVPHVDLFNILREWTPEGPEVARYLEGYGLSQAEFRQILPQVRGFELVERLMDVIWAMHDRPDLVSERSCRATASAARVLGVDDAL